MKLWFSNIKFYKLISNCRLILEKLTLLKIITIANKNKYYNEQQYQF